MRCVRPMASSHCVHACIRTHAHAVLLQLVPTAPVGIQSRTVWCSAHVQVPFRHVPTGP